MYKLELLKTNPETHEKQLREIGLAKKDNEEPSIDIIDPSSQRWIDHHKTFLNRMPFIFG